MNSEWLILKILLLFLATWRLYRLFATDTGWHEWLRKLRIKLGVEYDGQFVADPNLPEGVGEVWQPDYSHWSTKDGSLAEGITCCWCASLWWGFLLAIFLLFAPTQLYLLVVLPLNASALCLALENGIYSRITK